MRYLGIILVMLAAFFWGISGGIASMLINIGWSPRIIAFYRGFIGLLCFLFWLLIASDRWNKKKLSQQVYLWSFIAGLGVAGNFIFYFLSIHFSSISIAATLMYTAPIFVLVASLSLGMEQSTWTKWIGVVTVVIGVFLLSKGYTLDFNSVPIVAIILGIIAGISYTIFLFGFKKAASTGEPASILTLAFLSFTMILFFFIDIEEMINVIRSNDLGWFILLGVLGAGLSFFIYIIGLRLIHPSTTAVVAMIEPLTAVFIGIIFLNNTLTVLQYIGIIIVLLSITFLSFKKNGPRKHA